MADRVAVLEAVEAWLAVHRGRLLTVLAAAGLTTGNHRRVQNSVFSNQWCAYGSSLKAGTSR